MKTGDPRTSICARSRGLGLLLLCLVLSACQPEAGTADAAPAAPVLRRDSALINELDQLERVGLSLPEDHAPALAVLLGRCPPGSAERLEGLSVRANLLGLLRDRPGFDAAVAELANWPDNALRRSARLAERLAQAQWAQNNGELSVALRLLAPLPPEELAPLERRLAWRALATLARVQADYGELDNAIENNLRALEMADGLGGVWRRVASLAALTDVSNRMDQPERALRYSDEALALARQDPNPVTLYDVYTVRGIVHASDRPSAAAREALNAALEQARAAGSSRLEALALGNLADHMLRRGEFAQAEATARQALELARQHHRLSSEILALHNLGIAKIGQRRIEEGKRDVLAAIHMEVERGAGGYTAESWRELGQYLEQAGDLPGALDAYHRSRELFDQVLHEESRKAVLEAEARYEDTRRRKEIELLNRGNRLKEGEILSRDLQLRLWAEVGACVLLSAALLSLAYRRIRRTNAALAQANESLREQSERDPLTGLSNRRHFQSVIRQADAGLRGSLFLIDIDLFKRINDQWGHAAGDSVLIEVARRLRAVLREQDLVVRWGGEEFLILIRSPDPLDAGHLAQRLLDQVGSKPVMHGSQAITVTASIGYACFPLQPHGVVLDWERALDLADTAMYMAKAHGRNKAYGVTAMEARHADEALVLGAQLESAWHAGRAQIHCVQGPPVEARHA